MSHSDDVIVAILRKIADGTHDDRDIDYLKKSMRSSDRNVVLFGDTTVYLEQGGEVVINSTVVRGADADAIGDVVRDLLDEHDEDIPRGSLRSVGGFIYGAGLLIGVGSVGFSMINSALGGGRSSHDVFPNAFIGLFVGAIVTVVGQLVKESEKRRDRARRRNGGGSAAARRTGPARGSGGSFAGGLSKLVEIAGVVICFIGIYLFVSPAFPLSSGEMTITELAAKGWPPPMAMQGFAVLAAGMVVAAVGKIMGGWTRK